MIRQILGKDWRLLWPMVALVLAIQVGYEFASMSSGLFEHRTGAEALLRPLMLAWFIGIAALAAAVIQQDPVPGADQDWLIRPLNRTDLLLAKMIFLAATVSAPMFVLNLAHALTLGMPFGASLTAVVSKECFIFACFMLPVAALASTTRNLTELVILGAALMVIFAVSLSASAFLRGPEWCPTCHTGMSWLQHLLQHIGVVVGAGVILLLQYYRRKTAYARGLAVLGAVALVVVQLPWNAALSIERRLSAPTGHAERVTMALAEEPPDHNGTSAAARRHAAGQTTQLLLRGNVDQAFEALHRRARSEDSPVLIDLPVRTIGASADEMLLLDRLHTQLFRSDGGLLYRGADAGPSPGLLLASPGDAPDVTHQTIEIPSGVFRAAAAAPTRLQMDLTLTLVKMREEHKIAALDGELRSTGLGLCATSRDGDSIILHCNSVMQAPFCYSAALYGVDGRHNPEIFKCNPDYRRHWPALIDVLNFYGLELPVRDPYGIAQYPVAVSDLANAYVLLKIYGERDHFSRVLTVPDFRMEGWLEKTR